MASVLQTLVLLGLAAAAAAAGVAPSVNAPGGLTPEQTPQFILFTHDDGVDAEARSAMTKVIKGRKAQGCPVTATMFVQADKEGWTVCSDVMKLYDAGLEIADHTVSHTKLPGMDAGKLREEIGGARDRLAACGVPKEDVVGFRTPYLDHDPPVRRALSDLGFLYDSSIIEDFQYSVSRGFGNRVWPFDMANGLPINCSLADLLEGPDPPTTICGPGERYDGLWEVPVWRFDNRSAGSGKAPYAMDPGYSYDAESMNDTATTFELLKKQFDATYAGNKAPFPVYIHIYWLKAADNIEQLQQFIDYASAKPGVYFVTMRQLLAWMQNPVPVDQLTPRALGCGNPGGAPGTLADGAAGSKGKAQDDGAAQDQASEEPAKKGKKDMNKDEDAADGEQADDGSTRRLRFRL